MMTLDQAAAKCKLLLGSKSTVEYYPEEPRMKCWLLAIENGWTKAMYAGETWEAAFEDLARLTKSYNI